MKGYLPPREIAHEQQHTNGDQKMHRLSKSHTFPILAIALLLVAALACGDTSSEPTGTSEAITTPEPIPVQPASIPGIDEPVVVGSVEIQVLEAYTEDSLSWGQSTVYPDSPSDIFLEMLIAIDGAENTFTWAVANMRLVHGDEEYEIVTQGRRGGPGGTLAGYVFVFSIPRESEYSEYRLKLAADVSIDLAPFFE